MPYYVKMTRIDWHLDDASPELRALVEGEQRDLLSDDHTYDTFRDSLRALAARRLDLSADALIQDGFRQYCLFRVRGGTVEEQWVVERAEGWAGDSLPLDEIADVRLVRDSDDIIAELGRASSEEVDVRDGELSLPLIYSDEAQMRAVMARVAGAIDDGDHAFVAEVDRDRDRYVVELRPGEAHVRRLVVQTEPELFDRLLGRRAAPGSASPPPTSPAADTPVQQALFFPAPVLVDIQAEAARQDRNLSWLIQHAWQMARERIAAADVATYRRELAPSLQGESRKQTLYLPGPMFDDIKAQAERFNCSLSSVVLAAWKLAAPAIRTRSS